MTCHLPLKILRVLFKCKPITKNVLQNNNISIKKCLSLSTSNYSQALSVKYKNLKSLSKSLFLPQYANQTRFKTYNEENRKKVRKMYKCDEKVYKRKLAFRNTSKEDCLKCNDALIMPTKDPKLKRLKAAYDASKLKWNHVCVEEFCADSQRVDDLCYKIEKKCLPKIELNDCEPCGQFVPTKAPELLPIKWDYDSNKLKQKRDCYVPECNVDPPRMDDVCGYKVTPKKLPAIKLTDECVPCSAFEPTIAPKLVPLKERYDPSKMVQKRDCYEPKCDEDPPRMDEVLGLKVTPKKLPTFVKNDCVPCASFAPTVCPEMKPLKPKYDASKMKWNHPICQDFCEDAKRMDDIRGYKIEPKTLPKLKTNECVQCFAFAPTKAPKLNRPKKNYDDSALKWKHLCPEVLCEKGPERMDEVMGLKIKKKKLPVLKSDECVPCFAFTPTVAPKLNPVKWTYDSSKLKQERDCYIPECNVDPPRMDDVCGYKVTPKKLPMLQPTDECAPCIAFEPTIAPKLVRLKERYDPSKMEQNRDCYKPKCDDDPPRMDNVVGLKVTPKKLPTIVKNDCVPCASFAPTYCPKIKPLEPKYDPSKLMWNHPDCKEFCADAKRIDDVVGYKVRQKKLPKLSTGNESCNPCIAFVPTKAPKLRRPKMKYNPYQLDRTCVPPEDLCDLDPPRMDDVRCWKPKRKILPSFTSSDRPRFYSTCTNISRKISYPIYTSNTYSKLSPKITGFYREYSKKYKLPKCKAPIPNPCLPRCSKFKLKECKSVARKVCEDYWEKPCKKTEAPYCSYSECPDTGLYEDEYSECEKTYQIRLQPQKQVSKKFYKVRPVTPAWRYIDPSLDRKCLAKDIQDPCELDESDKWQNPCPNMRVAPCRKRYRRHCNDQPIHKKCKKLEAPYKSFSERCPQFPEVEFTECDATEKCFEHGLSVHGFKCYKDYMVNYTASGKEEIKKPDCLQDPKKPTIKCSRQSPSVVGPKRKRVECDDKQCKKEEKMPDCPKQKSEDCKPKPKSKCSGSSEDKISMIVTSPNNDKKGVCVCVPIKEPSSNKASISCPSNDVKKMVCIYKPIEKSGVSRKSCSSKPAISCKPRKVSCQVNPAKAKCLPKCAFSKSKSICSGYKVSDANVEQQQSCNPQVPPSALSLYPIKVEIPAANTMWEKICAYFKARPGCPTPAQLKQKELEEEARKAAARAGLQIADSRIKLITITLPPCDDNLITKKKRNPKCSMKPKPFPKSCSCPMPKIQTNCKKTVIPKKQTNCKNTVIPKKQTNCKKTDMPNKQTNSKKTVMPNKQTNSKKTVMPTKPTNSQNTVIPKCTSSKNLLLLTAIKEKCRVEAKKKDSACNTPPNKVTSNSKKKPKRNSKNNSCIIPPKFKKPGSDNCKKFSTYTCAEGKMYKMLPLKQKRRQPYSIIASKKTYFSTTTFNFNKTKGKETIKYNFKKDFKSRVADECMTNNCQAYLTLNDNYIGKMSTIKLSKIGLKNALITSNVEENPYTICHTCRIFPKHKIF